MGDTMINFDKKILIIGGGAVCQCTVPLILKNIKIPAKNIAVIDAVDTRHLLQNVLKQGVVFQQQEINKDNYPSVLAAHLRGGDVCIDLANEVDTVDILTWCLTNQVMYLNTNLNLWKNHISINMSFAKVKSMMNEWKEGSPTAVISHGANPGLISSFAKQALLDSGAYVVRANKMMPIKIKEIEKALADENFAQLAQLLQIRTIHISERDSQKMSRRKRKNEFINTWSVIEFINESTSTIEFAWGNHEQEKPLDSNIADNTIFISEMAARMKLKSWVPQEEIEGTIPPHDETFSIADYLMVTMDDQVMYRPTVVFVYDASPVARKSMEELIIHNMALHEKYHVMKEEIVSGKEKMGCLILGDNVAWWTGSILSIEQSNNLVPKQNATVMQVAAGVLSALHEMIANPTQGICYPEQLNHAAILKIAKPYLGDLVSQIVTWKPKKNTTWEFRDFMVTKRNNKK